MKRFIIAALALVASAAFAQQTPAPASAAAAGGKKIVAVVNGETVTRQTLDDLYDSMNPGMRAQYDAHGGKAAFLENYVQKRLVLQEAAKSGFDKKHDVQVAMEAARDSALFDRYVRDVVASQVISEADLHTYYNTHQSDFTNLAMVKAYQIILLTTGPKAMPEAEAATRIQKIARQLQDETAAATKSDPASAPKVLLSFFENAARQYSQDDTASLGGYLGWFPRGNMDPAFETAAFSTPAGTMSAPVLSKFGYHLIYVEATRPAGVRPFAEVRDDVRERLLRDRTADIMSAVARLTTQLRASGKVLMYPENIN